MNDNILDFVVYPAHVANGNITREEIMNRLMDAAKNCDLTAIDKLKFYKEIEKAAAEASKAYDEQFGLELNKAANLQGEAVTGGVKGEFMYNGCYYQLREDVEHDLSDYNKYKGQDGIDWRRAKEELERLNTEATTIRNNQATQRQRMESAAKNYAANHKDYSPVVNHTVVVLDSAKKANKKK